jgi:hypothetical protein
VCLFPQQLGPLITAPQRRKDLTGINRNIIFSDLEGVVGSKIPLLREKAKPVSGSASPFYVAIKRLSLGKLYRKEVYLSHSFGGWEVQDWVAVAYMWKESR